jgi:small-conductance mechanosensitive channel
MSARFPWILLFLGLLAGVPAEAQLQAQDPRSAADADAVTAPVEFDGAVLFHVRGVSSFPADVRARTIRERLADVVSDPAIPADALRVAESPEVSRIVAGNRLLLAVTDADAAMEQVRRSHLAAIHLARLRQAVIDYRDARSPASLRRAAARSAIATLVLIVAIAGLRWFWRQVDRLFTRRLKARIHSLEFHSFEVMRAEQIARGLASALIGVRTVVFLVLALGYVGYVLTLWPWTRGASQSMADFALRPLEVMGRGIVAHIPSLAFLAVLFFVVRTVLRLIRLFFDAVARGSVALSGFDVEWAEPTYKIVRLAVVAFGVIVAYPYIPGSDSAAFRGVSVFLGIIVSLGSSSAISNIIAGYMMTYRRAFRVGDRVKIGDAVGEVVEMRLQVTHLRSPKNEELVIPNSQILGSQVLNYTSLARTRGLILHTEVGIGYETPWRQVEAMLLGAADRTAGCSREPPPFVLEKRLGDFAVTYELNVFCANVSSMPELYASLHRNILDVFNEYGVQIMTPAYEHDPEAPKVVPKKDWYAAPAEPENLTPAPLLRTRASRTP